MRLRRSMRIACAAALAASGHAEGGPPMLTDDPGTPGNGRWEINLAGSVDVDGGAKRWELPYLDVNYGLGDHVQLKAESAWIIDDDDDVASGLGPSMVGVKWRFLDEDGELPAMSTYPQVEVGAPARWAVRGETSRAVMTLPLEVERRLGEFTVGADGGVLLQHDEQSQWFWGVIVGHELGRGELMAEVHTLAGVETIGNVGGRFQVFDHWKLLASIGRRLGDSGPQLTSFLGIQLAL